MRTGSNFFSSAKSDIQQFFIILITFLYYLFFLLSCSCNRMSAFWLIALFFMPEFTIQYLLLIYLMGCEKGLFCWIFWCVPHKCNIFFQTFFHDFLLNHIGPPQFKCRLLSSSIFDAMNFQHFSEKLEIMFQHFRKMLEIHCIKNART